MPEYLDVLTPEGHQTGKKKLRRLVHQDGDWHRTVHIFIVTPRGDIFLQKRSTKKKTYQHFLDISVCGHVSAGSASLESAVREIEEEVGLRVRPEDLTFLFSEKQQEVLLEGRRVDNAHADVYLLFADIDASELHVTKEIEEVVHISFSQFQTMVETRAPNLVPRWSEYEHVIELVKKKIV